MKKFLLSMAALALLIPAAKAQSGSEETYPYWYISGTFNNYNPDHSDEWALFDDGADDADGTTGNPGVYTGTFTVPAGSFSFYLLDRRDVAMLPYDFDEYEYLKVTLDFSTNHTYKGLCSADWDDEYEYYYWTCPDWVGGQITVSVDANDNNPTVEIYAIPGATGTNDEYSASFSEGVITLAWENVGQVVTKSGATGAYLLDGEKQIPLTNYKYDSSLGIYQGNIEVSYSEPLGILVHVANLGLTSGKEYTLVIPEGYLEITSEDWTTESNNPAISYKFTYVKPNYPETLYVLGAFNDFTQSDNYVISNLNEEEPAVLGGLFAIPAGQFDFYLKLGDTYYCAPYATSEVTLKEDFSSSIFKGGLVTNSTGYYHWVCENWPGGSVDFNVDLAAQTVTIYLSPTQPAAQNSDYTISYEGEDLISITWANVDQVGLPTDVTGAVIEYGDDSIQLEKYVYNSAEEAYSGNLQAIYSEPYGINIHLEDLELETGKTYTLVIPANFLEVVWNDWDEWGTNPTISYEFTYGTSLVNKIEAVSNDNVTIYNLQGQKMNDINSLSNGIYIINGKKVVVRK